MLRGLFLALLLYAAGAHAGPVDEARLVYIRGDHAAALKILIPAAEAGDANAQNILGAAYEDGNGVERDTAKAVEWYAKSAAQGYGKALLNLGLVYAQGREGIPHDYARATDLLKKAAGKGIAAAWSELGVMAEFGRGMPADPARAAEFYARAHAGGAAAGSANLGALYLRGRGVEHDFARAFELLSEAAAKGHVPALNNLGVMYENGYHVSPDRVAGWLYYRAAARRGNPRAAMNLARLLRTKGGLWHDPTRALAWCLWAARQTKRRAHARKGDPAADGAKACTGIEKSLSPDQKARAAAIAGGLARSIRKSAPPR